MRRLTIALLVMLALLALAAPAFAQSGGWYYCAYGRCPYTTYGGGAWGGNYYANQGQYLPPRGIVPQYYNSPYGYGMSGYYGQQTTVNPWQYSPSRGSIYGFGYNRTWGGW